LIEARNNAINLPLPLFDNADLHWRDEFALLLVLGLKTCDLKSVSLRVQRSAYRSVA